MSLLDEIDAYCAAKEISGARFGLLATGDSGIVAKIRAGYRIGPLRATRLRTWMERNLLSDLRSARQRDTRHPQQARPAYARVRDAATASDIFLARLWAFQGHHLLAAEEAGRRVALPVQPNRLEGEPYRGHYD